jgi:hypothetical protein
MELQLREPKIKDAEYIAEWRSMLNVFNTIIEKKPNPEKVKNDLAALCESAKNTIFLTGAQKDGIVARCRNYSNGTYGVNKIKDAYSQPTA